MSKNKWERAIDSIQTEVCDGCEEKNCESCDYKTVLDALEKQNPVSPYQCTCPKCGADANDEYGHKKYCSSCGQKLDWEGHHGKKKES